ncbi:MAG: PIN domain-containing protein [bacterium]|nr:PIN domain-containing protein [bacterium]MDZ4284299.1 PIN domain-containing protein [Patescibacteria group bacterium]
MACPLQRFFDSFVLLGLDATSARKAGMLKRDYRTPFADAIVAATALIYNLPLVTRNVRHYQPIEAEGLRIVRPY